MTSIALLRLKLSEMQEMIRREHTAARLANRQARVQQLSALVRRIKDDLAKAESKVMGER